MYNRTLKSFYHGNLTPINQQMVHGSEAEDRLAQVLPPELQSLMECVAKAQGKVDIIMAEASYIDGFKTGARFMLEILDDSHENLKPITE